VPTEPADGCASNPDRGVTGRLPVAAILGHESSIGCPSLPSSESLDTRARFTGEILEMKILPSRF
jgi:hypothetical protein